MAEVVDKHTDSEVLENSARVMENLCNEDFPIAGKCNVARSTLIDNLVQKYKEAFKDFFSGVSVLKLVPMCYSSNHITKKKSTKNAEMFLHGVKCKMQPRK